MYEAPSLISRVRKGNSRRRLNGEEGGLSAPPCRVKLEGEAARFNVSGK